MTARIFVVHADGSGIPVLKLKGGWLKSAGFKGDDKIAVCIEQSGKLTVINMDTKIQKLLESEYPDLLIIE